MLKVFRNTLLLLSIILALSVIAVAQTTGIDSTSTGTASGSGQTSVTWAHTVGTGGLYPALFVVVAGLGTTISTVTYDTTQTMTLVANCASTGGFTCRIYRLLNPNSGTHNIVISFPSFNQSFYSYFAGGVSMFGVDQTTPENVVATSPTACSVATTITLPLVRVLAVAVGNNSFVSVPSSISTNLWVNTGAGAQQSAAGYSGERLVTTYTVGYTCGVPEGVAVVGINPQAIITNPQPMTQTVVSPSAFRPTANPNRVAVPAITATQYQGVASGGDTQYCTWTGPSTLAGNFGGGSILCNYNDGAGFGCASTDACLYKMVTYSATGSPAATFANVNTYTSYGPSNGNCYDGTTGTPKTRALFSLPGLIFQPQVCLTHGTFSPRQAGIAVSPDGGAHWCNYKTYLAHTGSPGCDSSNWKANGDFPTDALGFQWPETSGNRMGYIEPIDFLCQDYTLDCPIAQGVDPAYIYFHSSSTGSDSFISRAPKSAGMAILAPANWQNYVYGTWQSNQPSNMSSVGTFALNPCCSRMVYLKDFGQFVMWVHPGSASIPFYTSPQPWGPWALSSPMPTPDNGFVFPSAVAGLCPTYSNGNVTCTMFMNGMASSKDLYIRQVNLGSILKPYGGISGGGGPGTTLSIGGVYTTNTQAVITYTVPNSSACTLEVSESASYTPVVNDLNASLFTGANSDSGGAAGRNWVVGKRLTATALDTLRYSRALQANTVHYYRMTCGTSVTTGQFTTKNIPIDSTYQDTPQLDPANPGETIVPTISDTDRTQQIIDPRTGALLKRVSLPGDYPYNPASVSTTGPFMFYSGAPRVCGVPIVGPDNGYLCKFAAGDGGQDMFYYIVPTTGESRYLGQAYFVGNLNATNNKFYSSEGGVVVENTYSGNYMNQTPGTAFPKTSVTLIANLQAAVAAYEAAFDSTKFTCSITTAVGDYLQISCYRSQQDSYAWVGTIRISTATVVALTRPDDNIQCRWCAVHQIVPTGYEQPVFEIITHEYNGSGLAGQGPYVTTLTGAINSSVTTIDIAGEPGCAACPSPDTSIPIARVGDTFKIGSERMDIVTKNSPTQWVVTRGAHGTTAASHSNGATVIGDCLYRQIFWKFLSDPHGTDTTNTYFVDDAPWTAVAALAHDDAITNRLLAEHGDGWVVRNGDLMTQIGQSSGIVLLPSALTFAGKSSNCFGTACVKHPSAGPTGASWISDFAMWDFTNGSPTMTNVSGQVYKLTTGVGSTISPRHFAIAAAVGANYQGGTNPHSLLDVSPAVLGTTSADNYKMCIANAPGECFAGSVIGAVYINVPGSPSLSCSNGTDVCVVNFNKYANGAAQIGTSGTGGRVVTGGLTGLRRGNGFPTAKTLADGSWLLFTVGDVTVHKPSQVLMAKLPPYTQDDAVDRRTFVPAAVSITAPTGQGITHASIEFGYLEQGTENQHYCTTRREACVVANAAITEATPFYYASTDTYSRLSCATSCTITLPVLPSHIAYYTVKFYNSSGAFVRDGTSGVAIEGTVK